MSKVNNKNTITTSANFNKQGAFNRIGSWLI